MPIFVYVWIEYIYNMERKLLNRIKVVLAEKNKSNKWLSEQLDKDPAIISKWVTNTAQCGDANSNIQSFGCHCG